MRPIKAQNGNCSVSRRIEASFEAARPRWRLTPPGLERCVAVWEMMFSARRFGRTSDQSKFHVFLSFRAMRKVYTLHYLYSMHTQSRNCTHTHTPYLYLARFLKKSCFESSKPCGTKCSCKSTKGRKKLDFHGSRVSATMRDTAKCFMHGACTALFCLPIHRNLIFSAL